MNKGLIVLGFLFLIIIGYGAYLYLDTQKELKEQEKIIYSNVTVFAFNEGKQIEVPFVIETLGQSYNGSTFKEGGSNYPILVNTSFKVYNLGNEYYKQEVYVTNDLPDNYRIDLNLNKSGFVNITTNSTLLFDENLILNNTLKGEFRNPKICLNWGLHVITTKINYLEQIDVINKSYTKCYKVYEIPNTLNISFIKFGKLDYSDFIDYCLLDELNTTYCYKFQIPENIIIN